MRRVTNCILVLDNQVLMLKKPRRGWYAMPGGKMESGETIKESATREFYEETGLRLNDPKLGGVFTFIIKEDDQVIQEWMMFTFKAHRFEGELLEVSDEGELEWVPIEDLVKKPMAEGDRHIFDYLLNNTEVVYGKFTYTNDYQLISDNLDLPG